VHFSVEMPWQNDAQWLIGRNKSKSTRETSKVIPRADVTVRCAASDVIYTVRCAASDTMRGCNVLQ